VRRPLPRRLLGHRRLDEVRRDVWRTARRAGATDTVRHGSRTIRISSGDAKSLARARYALWKNPENLTGR
jgi:transposase